MIADGNRRGNYTIAVTTRYVVYIGYCVFSDISVRWRLRVSRRVLANARWLLRVGYCTSCTLVVTRWLLRVDYKQIVYSLRT